MEQAKTKFYVPDDFKDDSALEQVGESSHFVLACESPAALAMQGDPWVVQRTLSAVVRFGSATLIWTESALALLRDLPGQATLFATCITLDRAIHLLENGDPLSIQRRVALQQVFFEHTLKPNWFQNSDSIVCFENSARGWNRSLYSGPNRLRSRGELAFLLNPIIRSKVQGLANEDLVLQWQDSLISVVYELFENTQVHARFDYDRATIAKDIVRSIMVRTVSVHTGGNPDLLGNRPEAECLEISVVDSGVGFFGAALQRPVQSSDSLLDEWKCLRLCLDKHSDEAPLNLDHRGVGLYEVLRALHFLRGAIQVRVGRMKAYRSFFDSDDQIMLEPRASLTRPGMPKVRMLDFNHPHRPTPTRNPEVRGVAVRTLVPLKWS